MKTETPWELYIPETTEEKELAESWWIIDKDGYVKGYTDCHEEYSADREKLIAVLKGTLANLKTTLAALGYSEDEMQNITAITEAQQLLTTLNKKDGE